MTNQREYGPMFFQKISRLIDSLNAFPPGQLRWATIRESFTDFLDWRTQTGLDSSQWQCGQTLTDVPGIEPDAFTVYPNPSGDWLGIEFPDQRMHRLEFFSFDGKLLRSVTVRHNEPVRLDFLPGGMYLLRLDEGKLLKY
jgi:hypothetical protein